MNSLPLRVSAGFVLLKNFGTHLYEVIKIYIGIVCYSPLRMLSGIESTHYYRTVSNA